MIDANGVRHHLFLGRADWSAAQPPPGDTWRYDDAAHVVALDREIFKFVQPAGDPVLQISARRGAARDRYGHWYWISRDVQSIRVRWSEARAGDHFWSSADPEACPPPAPGGFAAIARPQPGRAERLAGLVVTTGNYLLVGAPDAGALLIFDLFGGGAPSQLPLPTLPGGPQCAPFDIAPLPDGGAVILDRAHKLLWRLDPTFRPVSTPPAQPGQALLFQPVDGPERVEPPAATPAPLPLAGDPISVEPLPDDTVLVLDRGGEPTLVRRYRLADGMALDAVALKDLHAEGSRYTPDLDRITGHDMAFAPNPQNPRAEADKPLGVLYVVDAGGNQAFALVVRLEEGRLALRVQSAYYPLRSHTGKAIVAPLHAPEPPRDACNPPPPAPPGVYFDQDERWTPVTAMNLPRYKRAATLELPTLDGRDPGCVWHRLCLDACIPPETAVRVSTRAADDPALLPLLPWQDEPPLYRRGGGAELPYYALWGKQDLQKPDTGTWELLFQRARGRYLDIRLELVGNGRATPTIRALRAHYPRFSYLSNYLPGVYQDDPTSASFLDRFLANPEGLFTRLEGLIADAQVHWDVRTTPAEALDWLAAWLGLALDPTWTDYQRRLLIAHAPYFYRRRGTMTGVVQAIRVATDPQPGPAIFGGEYDDRQSPVRIVERYRTRRAAGVVMGDVTETSEPAGDPLAIARARAHRFVVLLPATAGNAAARIALVERLVALEKPAHTDFTVKHYWDMFRVGEARLALDTRLGHGWRYEPGIYLGETGLAEGGLRAAYPFDLRNDFTDRVVVG